MRTKTYFWLSLGGTSDSQKYVCVRRLRTSGIPVEINLIIQPQFPGSLTPLPFGISNSLCDGGRDIFWNHTILKYTSRVVSRFLSSRFHPKSRQLLSFYFSNIMLQTDLLTFRVAAAVFGIAGGMCWLPAYYDNPKLEIRGQCGSVPTK